MIQLHTLYSTYNLDIHPPLKLPLCSLPTPLALVAPSTTFLPVPYPVNDVPLLFRIPHKPPAGSLKVLHAPARRGGIRRVSQTKIYNLETNEFVSNPPFLKLIWRE